MAGRQLPTTRATAVERLGRDVVRGALERSAAVAQLVGDDGQLSSEQATDLIELWVATGRTDVVNAGAEYTASHRVTSAAAVRHAHPAFAAKPEVAATVRVIAESEAAAHGRSRTARGRADTSRASWGDCACLGAVGYPDAPVRCSA